jgi:hypothetical protein
VILAAADGLTAQVTKLEPGRTTSVFTFDARDPAGRVWRARCTVEWSVGHALLSAPDKTDIQCHAYTGSGRGAVDEVRGSASFYLYAQGVDSLVRKQWNGALETRFHRPGREAVETPTHLAMYGDGATFVAGPQSPDTYPMTVHTPLALVQALPTPVYWMAPGVRDEAFSPAIFFVTAALHFAGTLLPPRPPP